MVGNLIYFIMLLSMYGGKVGYILDYGYGARAFGMGSAYYGISGDVISGAYNPASLGFLTESGISFLISPMPLDERYIALSYSQITNSKVNYAFFANTLKTPGFEGRDEFNRYIGPYWFVQYSGGISLCWHPLLPFALGAKLKFLYSRIREDMAGGFGIDIGAYYYLNQYFQTGLVLRNVVPISIKYISKTEKAPFEVVFGINFSPVPFLHFTSDVEYSTFSGLNAFAGAEAAFLDVFRVRAGINAREITGGIGVIKQYKIYALKIDYAYAMPQRVSVFHDLHRFSVSFIFSGYRVFADAEPKELEFRAGRSVAKIHLHVKIPYEVKEWRFEIYTSTGDLVRSFKKKGRPPLTIMWDARDSRGNTVPEGTYRYKFIVIDKYGNYYVGKGILVKVRMAL